MTKVLIVQRVVPHYRVEFFRRLHAFLKSKGIELTLVYGQHLAGSVPETVHLKEHWAIRIKNRYINFLGFEAIYQPVDKALLLRADVIIVEQANRLLLNYRLIALKRKLKFSLAFWGHGKNFQSRWRSDFFSKLKDAQIRHVDYWFAYTSVTSKILLARGVEEFRISTVNNTIDSDVLFNRLKNVSADEVNILRDSLGFSAGPTGLFCGGMDERKRLPFLLTALDMIKKRLPDFSFIFIGDGPFAESISMFCKERNWIHYAGKVTSVNRMKFFALSDAMLMPGALGLVIIDSLVTETPLITTKLAFHNPEIAYLKDGENAIFTEDDVDAYVEGVCDALSNRNSLSKLQENCSSDAKLYTLDVMVENFASGIEQCLNCRTDI